MSEGMQEVPEGLSSGIDYLWCPGCRQHIPCVRTESGDWEVGCPNCVGECGFCNCPLRDLCYGRRQPVSAEDHPLM